MIIGTLDNTSEIEKLHPHFKIALDWLRENYRTIHSSGAQRVEIIPDKVIANIDTATMKSKESQIIETHIKYIDIHVPVDQSEVIGWTPVNRLGLAIEKYDTTHDRAFYQGPCMHYTTIKPGEFCIMTPTDGHSPIIGKGEIHKICMKIKVETEA